MQAEANNNSLVKNKTIGVNLHIGYYYDDRVWYGQRMALAQRYFKARCVGIQGRAAQCAASYPNAGPL